MKRFNCYMPLELYTRIKEMAKFYKVPISTIMVDLLEIGYIYKLGGKK